jgi:predicted transcriptional regulator
LKAHELKYLMILRQLQARPGATQAALAESADMPAALVNRYLKRLSGWRLLRASERGGRAQYALTRRGERELHRASWEFAAFLSLEFNELREQAVRRLREATEHHGWARAVLYGATPLADVLGPWLVEAGLEPVALCDEERAGADVVRLSDLDRAAFDCVVLADWDRAADSMLLRLLAEYGPVVNLFAVDGTARPRWE